MLLLLHRTRQCLFRDPHSLLTGTSVSCFVLQEPDPPNDSTEKTKEVVLFPINIPSSLPILIKGKERTERRETKGCCCCYTGQGNVYFEIHIASLPLFHVIAKDFGRWKHGHCIYIYISHLRNCLLTSFHIIGCEERKGIYYF
jgi:hypothetical protein